MNTVWILNIFDDDNGEVSSAVFATEKGAMQYLDQYARETLEFSREDHEPPFPEGGDAISEYFSRAIERYTLVERVIIEWED